MGRENEVLQQDLEQICQSEFIPWGRLCNKTLFVTGATGLVGYTLINALLYANEQRGLNLRVLALSRDRNRAMERFAGYKCDSLTFVEGDVCQMPEVEEPVHFIIHAAGETASKAFVQHPVETICTIFEGTRGTLELARRKRVESYTFLSSMEVYGHPRRGHSVKEEEECALSPQDVRSSYPVAKLQAENLCRSYACEYSVPASVVRLTQTFGPGVDYNDTRVFAEFARCVIEKRDIVLRTKGETERSYLYTADAATAIITVMLMGEPGQTYNAADNRTYCSIAEMAESVAEMGGVRVRFNIQEESKNGFLTPVYINLDTEKLCSLGWRTIYEYAGGSDLLVLTDMYKKLIDHWIR